MIRNAILDKRTAACEGPLRMPHSGHRNSRAPIRRLDSAHGLTIWTRNLSSTISTQAFRRKNPSASLDVSHRKIQANRQEFTTRTRLSTLGSFRANATRRCEAAKQSQRTASTTKMHEKLMSKWTVNGHPRHYVRYLVRNDVCACLRSQERCARTGSL